MIKRLFVALLSLTVAGPATGQWSLRLQQWQEADTALPGLAPDAVERQALGLAWHGSHGNGHTGVAYLGQPVLIDIGNPATNGYLHQIDVEHQRTVGDTRLVVALGVHGSSNVFTHAEFRRDVLTGRFDVLHPITERTDVGLAGDYRYGEFLIYPRLRITVSLGGNELLLDLPVGVHLGAPDGRWRLGVQRYGDKWATLDTTETVEGKFYLSEWQLTGQVRIGQFAGVDVQLGAGLSFDTEARYLDLERGRVKAELDPAAFAFIVFRR